MKINRTAGILIALLRNFCTHFFLVLGNGIVIIVGAFNTTWRFGAYILPAFTADRALLIVPTGFTLIAAFFVRRAGFTLGCELTMLELTRIRYAIHRIGALVFAR
jgi:hypothetical protein